MALFKCKMCGGTLEINGNESVATCEYCGTQQTIPKLDDDRRANLYDRANHFRRNNEFDKAMNIYEQILTEDNSDAEAYWSLVLCRYGIEYVEDPSTHKRIPTVNRAQFTSIFDDDNYKSALRYADGYQKSIYEDEAKTINEIQKGILAISQKEEPFDVFICYKESDNNGKRTPDSVLAQDLYYQLVQEGFKVFFARITLEDKLGSAYEPYIFAALNSAKVMVALGTKPEFFKAVWVRNEWSRYLALIKQGDKKMLIPAYKDMDPYELPEEFSHLQAQDMSKLGFMQDLIRGIKKIINVDKPVIEVQYTAPAQSSANPFVKRAALFLEDGDITSANEYCEKALDTDPECADAYIIKLLLDLGIRSRDELETYRSPFDDNPNYLKAIRFGDDATKTELSRYNENIKKRNKLERLEKIYSLSVSQLESAQNEGTFLKIAEQFESISEYKDAAELAVKSREAAEVARKDAILTNGKSFYNCRSDFISTYETALEFFEEIPGWKDADEQIAYCNQMIAKLKEKEEADRLERERKLEIEKVEMLRLQKKFKRNVTIGSIIVAVFLVLSVLWATVLSPLLTYSNAKSLLEKGEYDQAIDIFTELGNYKDASVKIFETKYAKAENFLSSQDYEQALSLFAELGDYKDSPDRINEIKYTQAGNAIKANNYSLAIEIYKELGDYSNSASLYEEALYNYVVTLIDTDNLATAMMQLELLSICENYKEKTQEIYTDLIDVFCEKEEFTQAIDAYKKTDGYDENSDKYKDLMYKQAQKHLDTNNFSLAKTYFKAIPGYLDSDKKIIECDYQQGVYSMSHQLYSNAISAFTRVKDYRDSSKQLIEAKYQYVKANLIQNSRTTYEYLKELKSAKYKDSANIYKELYKWTVTLECANTNSSNYTTILDSISRNVSYFHYQFRLSGGTPGEKATFYHKTRWPDGSVTKADWYWEDETNGSGLGCYWSDGFSLSKAGTMTFEIYNKNTNELVGSFQIEVR